MEVTTKTKFIQLWLSFLHYFHIYSSVGPHVIFVHLKNHIYCSMELFILSPAQMSESRLFHVLKKRKVTTERNRHITGQPPFWGPPVQLHICDT